MVVGGNVKRVYSQTKLVGLGSATHTRASIYACPFPTDIVLYVFVTLSACSPRERMLLPSDQFEETITANIANFGLQLPHRCSSVVPRALTALVQFRTGVHLKQHTAFGVSATVLCRTHSFAVDSHHMTGSLSPSRSVVQPFAAHASPRELVGR